MRLLSTAGKVRFWNGAAWESPDAAAATSAQQALDAQLAALGAKGAAEAAQGAAETARDKAQSHTLAASLASNASEWVSQGGYIRGQLLWSPIDAQTYCSLTDHSGSTVDPSLDAVNFAVAAGGGSLSKAQNLADLTDKAASRGSLGLGSAATRDVAANGNATATQVVKGDDSRLTDARAPTTHQHSKSDITDFNDGDYATAAQGGRADTAVQPTSLDAAEQRSRLFSLWIGG